MPTPVILDLDGTLMPSHAVDNQCYWRAVGESFGRSVETLDLSGFDNVTDDGLLRDWCLATLGRTPSAPEREDVRACFLALIEASAKAEPAAFAPTPGLQEWLERQPRGSVAVATGGWEHTARWKLRAAGLDRFELPLAGSNSDPDRPAIMRRARARLAPAFAAHTPVYLGDGPWDLAAAMQLGWGFIGIAEGDRAERLRRAGAERVVQDFSQL